MARTHEVLEVGDILVGHVVMVEDGWCSWWWLVMDGNDGSYRPMGTPYIVPVRNTLSPSSHARTSPTRSISHPMTAPWCRDHYQWHPGEVRENPKLTKSKEIQAVRYHYIKGTV